MPRAHRVFCRGYVWHLTHRCHQRAFLLKFARDRRRWRHWLFEARRRYGLCVLNYIATSNHVHLLVADRGKQEVASSMQLIAGQTAHEYNRRKKRKGAFWEDRYHATAVQTDQHLIRCLSYIDLNMVRAGAVRHPKEWKESGYHEIQCPRRRKGIIDHKRLCELVGIATIDQLKIAHNGWIDDALPQTSRDPVWTESVAIGDETFLVGLKERLGAAGIYRTVTFSDDITCLNDVRIPYGSFSPSK